MSAESRSVEDDGRALGEAIADLPAYRSYEKARAAVEADEETQAMIDEFERARREFEMARQMGQATQEDLAGLRQLQEDLHNLPVMARYLEANRRLTERLATLNDAISAPLSIDFAGEAGGCCHD